MGLLQNHTHAHPPLPHSSSLSLPESSSSSSSSSSGKGLVELDASESLRFLAGWALLLSVYRVPCTRLCLIPSLAFRVPCTVYLPPVPGCFLLSAFRVPCSVSPDLRMASVAARAPSINGIVFVTCQQSSLTDEVAFPYLFTVLKKARWRAFFPDPEIRYPSGSCHRPAAQHLAEHTP